MNETCIQIKYGVLASTTRRGTGPSCEPVLGALAKSVKTFLTFHSEVDSIVIAALILRWHLENFLLHISGEKLRLDFNHKNIMRMLSTVIYTGNLESSVLDQMACRRRSVHLDYVYPSSTNYLSTKRDK